MQRVTVTLDDELIAELERYMKGRGYNNRSEAIRDLARTGMQQARGESSGTGDCVAALVYAVSYTHLDVYKRQCLDSRRRPAGEEGSRGCAESSTTRP